MKKFSLIMAGAFTALAVMTGCTSGETVNVSFDEDVEVNTEVEAEPETETKTEEKETVEEDVEEEEVKADTEVLADGEYVAVFKTDNSMFHVNETLDDKGTLTVVNGEMTIHISLQSKSIVNLYPGLAEDAQKDGAVLLEPTIDTVTYEDGLTEEVNGFDVPVPYLNDEFDLALIGTKGKWYDHKVTVTLVSEDEESDLEVSLEDGEYTIDVKLEGGTGKATITSPCKITVKEGKTIATIEWNSPNYDYMIVNEEKYTPVNTEGNSVFEIPVNINEPNEVVGDTVAMSKPHEIEYTLNFDKDSVKEAE